MKAVLLLLTILWVNASCQLWMETGNPWIDTASCPPVDTEKVCSLKKKQCSPVNNIIKPPGEKGLVGLIRYCAALSGRALDLKFFFKVGISYAHNNPETIMDNLSSDPKVSSNIRACVLNSTGLIGTDGKFNRTAAMDSLTRQPLGSNLVIPLFKGLLTCPEPTDYQIGPFLSCLRKACLASATAIFPPFEGGDGISPEPTSVGMSPPVPASGMYGMGVGMKAPSPGMAGPGGPGIIDSIVGKLKSVTKVGAGGSPPWASFIPAPGTFGGASGPSSFGAGSAGFGPGSFSGPSSFGPGSFGGGSKAGPGAGGKWF